MANVLVYIRTEGVRAHRHSLETLGEARRIATTLGGTLYAVAAVPATKSECGALIDEIAEHGADRIAVALAEHFDSPACWGSRQDAFASAIERIRPTLILLAADAPGRDIAPRLAARLQAAFFSEPEVHYGAGGEVVFSRSVYGATHRLRLSAEDLPCAAVATLTPGSCAPARGSEDAEVLFLELGEASIGMELVGSEPDPGATLESARVVVTAGAGCNDREAELVAELAAVLGGESAITRTRFENGGGGGGRVVDVSGRSVAPQLYVACGASGSMGHLGAVASAAEIVAINRDPKAAIFRVASYGLIGELSELLPELIAETRSRRW